MSDINGKIRDAIKSALISQNKITEQLAQETGMERSQIDRLASGLEGSVPKPLLEVLDALGLELLVHPKEQKEQTLSSMLQDNARS
jgi:transcriptional regulator with XRE-family HTH domain